MDEDVFNMALRKFLKQVGVSSQREIEQAVRAAIADGRLKGDEILSAKVVLTVGTIDLSHEIESDIALR
jgi:hypothetical protein